MMYIYTYSENSAYLHQLLGKKIEVNNKLIAMNKKNFPINYSHFVKFLLSISMKLDISLHSNESE
jgi:hypothetical protein